MPDHSIQALTEERNRLNQELLNFDGELEYHQGMVEYYRKRQSELEDKISEISHTIICLENA